MALDTISNYILTYSFLFYFLARRNLGTIVHILLIDPLNGAGTLRKPMSLKLRKFFVEMDSLLLFKFLSKVEPTMKPNMLLIIRSLSNWIC
jgi:hypothetical protein